MDHDPDADPVREAVQRYFARFPELAAAFMLDVHANAFFKHIERAMVQADIAMQDEGLDHEARRRVVTCALYGSVDEEAAVQRQRQANEMIETLKKTPFFLQERLE